MISYFSVLKLNGIFKKQLFVMNIFIAFDVVSDN